MFTEETTNAFRKVQIAVSDAALLEQKSMYTTAQLVIATSLPYVRHLQSCTLGEVHWRANEVLELLQKHHNLRIKIANTVRFEMAAKKKKEVTA